MDEKTNRCMSFVLERIQRHREQFRLQNKQPPPFFLGINGVQGAGKTTLVGLMESFSRFFQSSYTVSELCSTRIAHGHLFSLPLLLDPRKPDTF